MILLTLAWPARGQTTAAAELTNDGRTIDDIVVTARKREERVIDIPESITAISSAELLRKGIKTVDDLANQTPNLQLSMRQDLTTDVVIRGVGAFGDVLGVGFNIDNVPNFTDQTMRLEDLESVEILKGPQGTLYGGSSIGGLIRYVSKRPAFNWDGEASAEAGSYNLMSVFAAQNLALIQDKLALRLSAYDSKGDGYLTNKALGIDGSPLDDYGARASLLYQASDAFSALLTLRHSHMRNGGDEYFPAVSVTGFKYDVPLFQPTYNTRSTYGAVLELNKDFESHLKLTSITSYTSALYGQNVDISFTPPGVPGQTLYTLPRTRPTVVRTQELRLTSPSGRNLDWLIGVYAASIENVLLNSNALSNYPPPLNPVVVNDFDTKRIDVAMFGTLNYHFGDFTLGAGARVARTKFRANVFVEFGGLPDQSASITTRAALPKVSLSYALMNDEQVYVSVAKGEEPGAINTTSVSPIPYQSETAISYEAGSKGQVFNRTLEYELAVFYVSNKNHQVQSNQYIPASGGLVASISNIGDSRTYGAEASTSWRATPELMLGVSGGYLSAKWIHGVVFGVPIDGATIPNAPEFTAALNAGYSRSLDHNLRIDSNFDMNYVDAMWWDLPNTASTKEPPHFIGNLRLAIGAESRSWQLSLRVTNILGAKYWTEFIPNYFPAGDAPCPGCNAIAAIGAPRQYTASVAFKY